MTVLEANKQAFGSAGNLAMTDINFLTPCSMYYLRANGIVCSLCLKGHASLILFVNMTTKVLPRSVNETANVARFTVTILTSRLRRRSEIGRVTIFKFESTCCNFPDCGGLFEDCELFVSVKSESNGEVVVVWLRALD